MTENKPKKPVNKEAQIKKRQQHMKKLKRNVDELAPAKNTPLKAIALKYDSDKGKAPKIMATGKGRVAEKILQVAEDNKVPFYEDETLSELLSKLDLDSEIPPELYGLVAEILAFVYQMNKLAKKRAMVRKRNAAKRKP